MTKKLISISNLTIFFLVLLSTSLFSQVAYSTDPYAVKRQQISQQNVARKVHRKQKLLTQQRQKYHQAKLLQQRKNQQRRQQQRNQPQYSPRSHNTNVANQQRIRKQNVARNAQKQRLAQQKRQKLQRTHQQRKQQQNGFRNVWDRVYHGFRFRDYNSNPLVRRYTREFSRSPVRIQRLAERSSDYLYMVVNELNRRGMPTELALLPFVESAYRNAAYSHAGAAGMWQFIPATGRTYGLHQTRSYDARLDSHQATRAALSYLQKLNRQFKGDWLLSLAAYNAGEYRVQREIDKNRRLGRRTDYWSLDLPRETRQYVPRLLAYKEIFRSPRKYGVHLRGIPNSPALARIQVNKPVNLRKAAAHAGLPPSRLLSLNSGFLHGITIPRYSKQILLPRRHAGRLNKVIQSLPPAADVHRKYARKYTKQRKSRRSRYVYHKVRLGDNLYRIARKHGTTVKKIKRLNKLRNNKIWPGKRLKVARGRSKTRRS
ncbi:MAG: transglycosylase SLT domain-containing protein [Cocleimonas sp.]